MSSYLLLTVSMWAAGITLQELVGRSANGRAQTTALFRDPTPGLQRCHQCPFSPSLLG